MNDLTGQVIRGYELRERIGSGGYGTVYRAYQPIVKREVAVKIILPQLASDPEFVRRFESEARIIAQLEHPFIVPLYDYWRESGTAYLVMRLLRGGSLRGLLKQQGALEPDRIAVWLDQIAGALTIAHKHRVVHRDLKPDNILLDEDGNAYLSDFGIAKDMGDSIIRTPVGAMLGTPGYLSPEQLTTQIVTAGSDLYSLGIVLYELLTGRHPFANLKAAEVFKAQIYDPLPRLRLQPPDLSDRLNAVIQWATRKDPARRCPDALTLAGAFHNALKPFQTPVTPPGKESVRALAPAAATPVFTPIFAADLKAKFYHQAELILERPRRLIGRNRLLAELHALLDANECILLHGMGGVGKTALAATIAAERIAAGKGPVIWLEAGNEDADGLFEALARAFDQQNMIATKTGDERIQAVREILLQKKALLVLDNVWNERAFYQVQKAIAPSMPLLVTSRHVMPLDGVVLSIGELDADQAVELFSYHARKDYSADADARLLCEKLGCHPFALEIAGKRIKVQSQMTPAQLLESIADAPHDLKLPHNFADEGREGLKDLLDDSVNELVAESREALVTMGAMFAPFASVELLALTMQREVEAVELALKDLQRLGLALWSPRTGHKPGHYRLHDLTYSYARALFASEQGDHQPMIAAVRQFVETHVRDYDDLEFEQNNILGAAQAARRGGDRESLIHIMKLLVSEGSYFDARGHNLLLLQRLDEAIEAARHLLPGEAETLHYLLGKRGDAHAIRGEFDHAFRTYQAALDLAPNPQRKAILLSLLGTVRFRQGADDYDGYLEKAYRSASEDNDHLVLCRVLLARGTCAKERKNFELAAKYLREAVEFGQEAKDSTQLCIALYNLGMTQVEQGRFTEALSTHTRGYEIAEKTDNYLEMGWAFSGMACAYHGLGERDQAQAYFDRALMLYRKVGATTHAEWVVNFLKNENYEYRGQDHVEV